MRTKDLEDNDYPRVVPECEAHAEETEMATAAKRCRHVLLENRST